MYLFHFIYYMLFYSIGKDELLTALGPFCRGSSWLPLFFNKDTKHIALADLRLHLSSVVC